VLAGRWASTAVAVLGLLGGCGHTSPPPDSRSEARDERLVVEGPIVIGFFPTVNDASLASDDSLAAAFDHFTGAIAKVKRCLEPHGIEVRTVFVNRVLVVSGARSTELPPDRAPDGIGAYLDAPGREPRIVVPPVGPSSLGDALAGEAAGYFGVPACRPAGQ